MSQGSKRLFLHKHRSLSFGPGSKTHENVGSAAALNVGNSHVLSFLSVIQRDELGVTVDKHLRPPGVEDGGRRKEVPLQASL